jgi:hypothetical protein
VFHLELRQRSNVARAFNLDQRELIGRFLGPHLAGRTLTYQDHEFEPHKLRLTILEGPELDPAQVGLGRGWANAAKAGADVTDRMVAVAREQTERPPGLDELKARLLGRLSAGAVSLGVVVALADDLLPGHRVSARVAVAELAVWELLHDGSIALLGKQDPIPEDEWQAELLRWDAWAASNGSVRVALL